MSPLTWIRHRVSWSLETLQLGFGQAFPLAGGNACLLCCTPAFVVRSFIFLIRRLLHTKPADEEDEAPDDESGSAAEKARISTGKGKGLTKSKLKGLKAPRNAVSYPCQRRQLVIGQVVR